MKSHVGKLWDKSRLVLQVDTKETVRLLEQKNSALLFSTILFSLYGNAPPYSRCSHLKLITFRSHHSQPELHPAHAHLIFLRHFLQGK